MLEQIQYEEQLGFEGVFVAEHYLGGYAFPSPAVFAAAVAQRTQRMRIGIGVSLLPLSHPIRIAEEYAMADIDAEAHAIAKKHFSWYCQFFTDLDQRAAWQSADYQTYQGGLSKLFGAIPYEHLDAGDCLIFGSPERCVQRLKRAEADYGLTYAIFEVNFGGFPHQQVMHSLERFAKEVMPHLQ